MVLRTEQRAKTKKEKMRTTVNEQQLIFFKKRILVLLLLNYGIEGNFFNVSKIQFMLL